VSLNVQDALSALGLFLALAGLWGRLEVSIGQMRQWQASHDRNDDLRHEENLARLSEIEARLRELEHRQGRRD
jgi:hypothetical protein